MDCGTLDRETFEVLRSAGILLLFSRCSVGLAQPGFSADPSLSGRTETPASNRLPRKKTVRTKIVKLFLRVCCFARGPLTVYSYRMVGSFVRRIERQRREKGVNLSMRHNSRKVPTPFPLYRSVGNQMKRRARQIEKESGRSPWRGCIPRSNKSC